MDYLQNTFKDSGKPLICIQDRIKAIEEIVKNSEPGDVIFISGRASFSHYEDGEETLYFTDEDIVLHTLEELKW